MTERERDFEQQLGPDWRLKISQEREIYAEPMLDAENIRREFGCSRSKAYEHLHAALAHFGIVPEAGKQLRIPGVPGLRPRVRARPSRTLPGEDLLFPSWSNVRRDLLIACAQAGITPCSPNDLRRTYAKWMRLARVPAEIVAPTMGHRDTRMVERVYGRLSPEEIGALLTANFAPDCIAGAFAPRQASENSAQGRNRTTDTGIFSPLLYQLSYLGVRRPRAATWRTRGRAGIGRSSPAVKQGTP